MEPYTAVSRHASRFLTATYSTSFSTASKLFPRSIRQHICNIYGMVRVADEIVDTYRRQSARRELDAFERRVYLAMDTGYSSDLIAHAFQGTARQFGIDKSLVRAFFASMREDLRRTVHTETSLQHYVYGSAEVVGLMCLRVFCTGDDKRYTQAAAGARALGRAFQKINFLRDLGHDLTVLNRTYLPGITPETFTDSTKRRQITIIRRDLAAARQAISLLPRSVRPAVLLSYRYFAALLHKLERTPAKRILHQRIRVNDGYKTWLFVSTALQRALP